MKSHVSFNRLFDKKNFKLFIIKVSKILSILHPYFAPIEMKSFKV